MHNKNLNIFPENGHGPYHAGRHYSVKHVQCPCTLLIQIVPFDNNLPSFISIDWDDLASPYPEVQAGREGSEAKEGRESITDI